MAKIKDNQNVLQRLYEQCSLVLSMLEDEDSKIGFKDRLSAMVDVKSILTSMGLTKDTDETANAGAAVRKYQQTFAYNAAGGRAKNARGVGSRGPRLIATGTDPGDDEPDI